MLRQNGDVLRAVSERRDQNLEYLQAKEQVIPETPLADGLLEVAVRGGHEAYIGLDVSATADAPEGASVEDTEELGLERHGQIADLVEKEDSSIGQLEEPLLSCLGTRVGPFLVAEQLGLHQLGRHSAAIQLDEGPFPLRRVPVQELRHQLLPAPGLSPHQDVRRRRSRHPVDELQELTRATPLPDEPRGRATVVPQMAHLRAEADIFGCLGDELADVGELEGLHHVVVGTLLHGLDSLCCSRVSSHEDAWSPGILVMDLAEELEPGDVGKPNIEQGHMDGLAPEDSARLISGGAAEDSVLLLLEYLLQCLPQRLLIFDQEKS